MLPLLQVLQNRKHTHAGIAALIFLLILILAWLWPRPGPDSGTPHTDTTQPKPALTVTLTRVQETDWPRQLTVDGNISAWQEAVIGNELGQLRITEVMAQVGDTVRRGQVLARLANETAAAELEEARAAVSELSSYASEAQANAERARLLREQGFYSQQTNAQYVTGEQASQARLKAAQARLENAELHLSKTRIVATDDGIISARNATVGSLSQPGHELFRLIRGGRLEWQVELPAEQLTLIRPGMMAHILLAPETPGRNGSEDSDKDSTPGQLEAKVRNVAPAIDPRSRTGLVYLDIPAQAARYLKAGMFVRGTLITGEGSALTLPQRAVVLRDGHTYVYTVSGQPARARLKSVRLGSRNHSNNRIEILDGLSVGDTVVDRGARFLAEGDIVQVVSDAPVDPASGQAGDRTGNEANNQTDAP